MPIKRVRKHYERELVMGMAASQARFLGLTARKNNVEFEGQQINQQRTALSNKSASHYSDLLGMAVPVCPAVEDYTQTIYSFEDGSLSNTLTSLIAQGDGCYKISYLSSYTNDFAITSAGATSVVNDNVNGYMIGADKLKGLEKDLYWSYIIHEQGQTYRLTEQGDNYTYTDVNGDNKTLIPATYPLIVSIIGPRPDPANYNFGPLIEDYENTACFSSVHASSGSERSYHLEHNLCRLVWAEGKQSVTSSDGITVSRTAKGMDFYSLANNANPKDTDQTSIDLQNALKTAFPELYQRIIDQYVHNLFYLDACGTSWQRDKTLYNITAPADADPTTENVNSLYVEWQMLWNEIDSLDYSQIYEKDCKEWEAKYDVYAGNYLDSQDYTKIYTLTEKQMFYDGQDPYLKSLSSDQLIGLYQDEVDYRTMLEDKFGVSQEGWYVRYVENTTTGEWEPVFYNGDDLKEGVQDKYGNIRSWVDTYKIGSAKVNNEIKGVNAYLEQDSTGRYINITIFDDTVGTKHTYALTVNTVVDNRAYDDAMNQYEYDKALYDQAIAEVNAKIKIIQAEDKNLEIRLKQLDTEQDAITNELDAVAKVIEKNVESSFKTFG